jgi:hypothetical protein
MNGLKQVNEFYGEGGSRKKQQLPSLLCKLSKKYAFSPKKVSMGQSVDCQ